MKKLSLLLVALSFTSFVSAMDFGEEEGFHCSSQQRYHRFLLAPIPTTTCSGYSTVQIPKSPLLTAVAAQVLKNAAQTDKKDSGRRTPSRPTTPFEVASIVQKTKKGSAGKTTRSTGRRTPSFERTSSPK
jgi:hypothetical protein